MDLPREIVLDEIAKEIIYICTLRIPIDEDSNSGNSHDRTPGSWLLGLFLDTLRNSNKVDSVEPVTYYSRMIVVIK